MEKQLSNILDRVLKISIIVFTLALVWFAFVYYPKVVNQFKHQPATGGGLVGNVEASSKSLPFGNNHFRIQYLEKSNVYAVMVSAQTTDQYRQYKSEADMTLKNILSLDRLCGLNNIVYSSNLPFVGPDKSPQGNC